MFIDETIVKLVAGKGGDGCTSFRREKFVDMGGPNGGNGGRGSDIIFKADRSLNTLIDLKVMKLIKGKPGTNGSGSNKNGASADDVIIKVPMGTTITNKETGEILADLTQDEEEQIIAKGGRGGRGNRAFQTNANKAPRISELGQRGETLEIKCELKVIADVGLVGLPSVGKSTILSMITSANPKIAAYHFTTLSPNLGVVKIYDDSFILADLPGLIEGASDGVGLGHKFLRHAMRTKIIAHVVDMSSDDPYGDYNLILNELKLYDEALLEKKSIIIASKMDLENTKENLKKFKEKVKDKEIFEISSHNNTGFNELILRLNQLIKEEKPTPKTNTNHKVYTLKDEDKFTITKEGSIWVIKGDDVEDLVLMTRFEEDEAVLFFTRKITEMGIDQKLEELGAQVGDEVKILDYIFNYKY